MTIALLFPDDVVFPNWLQTSGGNLLILTHKSTMAGSRRHGKYKANLPSERSAGTFVDKDAGGSPRRTTARTSQSPPGSEK